MRLRIVIMATGFPPEPSSARLNYEMALELSSRGHHVKVVTVLPRRGHTDRNTDSKGRIVRTQILGERLSVIRAGFRLPMSEGLVSRAFQYIAIPIWLLLGAAVSPKPHAILCESPPLLEGIAAHVVSKLKGVPFAVRIQDIHPDVLEEAGFIKNRLLIALMRSVERFVYEKATLITTISPAYRQRIISKGVSPDKVIHVPNWANDLAIDSATPRELRRELGLSDCFLVTYAGSMSWFQDLETVIVAAKALESVLDIRFLLIGDGAIKNHLVKCASDLGLKNVIFLPFQSRRTYVNAIVTSDVCLVSLKTSVTAPEMPSKLLEIMMAGTAVLANVPDTSDISRVVREAGCGCVVDPESPEAFANAILSLYQKRSDLKRIGSFGREYAIARFSLKSSIDELERLLLTILGIDGPHPNERPFVIARGS